MPNDTKKPVFKFVAIAVSAVLVAALAATGIVAYGQNNTGNLTAFDETNATGTASANMTTSSNATDSAAVNETSEEETFTASAEPNSQCSSVITVDDGTVSLNSTTTMTAEALSEEAETMTAGLNDTQVASLDQLIENACDAIREGKSVTALGHLQTARDILSGASETETAEAGDEGEVEDEDESGDIDVEDEEDEGLETE